MPDLWIVPTRVARSREAFAATSAQNPGHLGTLHGHKIFQYSHFTALFGAKIHLKDQNFFWLFLVLLYIIAKAASLTGNGRWFSDVMSGKLSAFNSTGEFSPICEKAKQYSKM